jgi:hypothetical protein
VPEPSGPAGAGVLLEVDHLHVERQSAAAELLGPTDARPAVGTQSAFPCQPFVEERVLVARTTPAADHAELAVEQVVEVGAQLLAKPLLLRAEAQIHRGNLHLTFRQI